MTHSPSPSTMCECGHERPQHDGVYGFGGCSWRRSPPRMACPCTCFRPAAPAKEGRRNEWEVGNGGLVLCCRGEIEAMFQDAYLAARVCDLLNADMWAPSPRGAAEEERWIRAGDVAKLLLGYQDKKFDHEEIDNADDDALTPVGEAELRVYRDVCNDLSRLLSSSRSRARILGEK